MTTQEPVKVAIIGTGGIAGSHIAAWRHVGERVRPVAAVDIDRARVEAFAAKHGIAGVYTDAGQMLEGERPDLVHICTPPAFHYPIIMQCLDAGAWVFCEKPLVASLRELDAVAEAERRTGNACVSVFQWRFGAAAQHLRRQIDAGTFGRPYVGLCATTWYRPDSYYDVDWRGTWASELGGVNMGQAIHLIDLTVWLMGGDWEAVTAIADTLHHDIDVEDTALAMVRFRNRALVSIVSSVLSPRQESRIRLDFERATLEVVQLYRYGNEDWAVTAPEGMELPDGAWPPADDEPASHGAELALVLDAMRDGRRPPANVDDIRPTFELLTAIYKSSQNGETVARGSIGEGHRFYGHVGGYEARASGS
jgi:predicted dehydrogenase